MLAVLVTLAMVAAGCTRSDDETETGAQETTAPEGGGGEPDGGGAGSFGDLEDVCGPGDATGDTAQGVTSDSIQVGTISDPGFVGRQGLNQELFDATEVFTTWCNEAGGINGREIEVVERDAKITEYKQRITEACQEDFMLVGGGGVFDDTGQEERLGCLLPEIPAYQVSSAARGADLAVRPLPTALDELPIATFQYIEQRFPDSTGDVGFLTGNVPSTVVVDAQNQEAVESLGWDITYEAQYNAIGEASWTPFAQAMQSDGVRGLVYTGEPENFAKLLQAFDDISYELDWAVVGGNALDATFIEVGGASIRNVFMLASVVPPFLAEENPATQQYLDLFEEHLPEGKSEALLGYNSFSAWLLFATAVKACGSEVTRACVFEEASGITDWTGGGLHAATDPSSGKGPRCAMVVEASPDGFAVPDDFETTDGLFRCADDSVVTLEGDYGEGVTLEDVGKSIDELE
ncbi:ABC transporter substrate-binding protein [Iamia sp. SCSIO 61187]|uniref:ABC transporter substrate-binding protein n=1 Tax=Iamia sp. SCSIO 61187 TaxID=2722752 RepID=UPI001C62BB50|nr:ABC transporter substrate-binding protein [Iamia sp. SCSIO 61187]QYG93637.1 ABC transporter substrate-binding protein [Iamia sp. SCSIO 61187]